MIEVIEKLLFIHESQIRRWGRKLGLFSIYSGVFSVILVPIFIYFFKDWFSEVKQKALSNYGECDIGVYCFVQELMETVQETYLVIGIVFLISAGLLSVYYGILILKLHKHLTNQK